MRQKLHLITLGVDDMQRAEAFYEHGLGWRKSAKSNEHLPLFQLGGIVLALYQREELAKDANLSCDKCSFPGLTISHNASSKSEVDEIMQKVVSLGATIVKPAQDVFWGGYSGYFRGTEGNLFEVAYNPFWEFDAQGNLDL